MSRATQAASSNLSEHGIVTDLGRLLRSRHWAQSLQLFSRQAARSMLLGNVKSRYRGRGMEFEEVRRYQPGDDIRTIDWKVSARAQGTFTKLFCEERERPCHILVDQRSPLFFGSTGLFKSVLAAELAAGISWAALAGGDRVGGQVVGDYQEFDNRSRRNKQAVLRFLHDIHELNQRLVEPAPLANRDANRLSDSIEECQRITRPGTAVFIVSDFHDFDQAAAKALSNLGKHTDISLFRISDPMEQTLALSGHFAISDGVKSARVRMSKQVQSAYQDKLSQQNDLLKAAAVQARALYAQVETTTTARKALIQLFAK